MAHGFLFINSDRENLQSSVFDSSSTALCLSLFFSIINGILFSLHSSSTGAAISFFPLHQQFSPQTSEFSLRLFINSSLPLSFFSSSTTSSSVFTIHQQLPLQSSSTTLSFFSINGSSAFSSSP
jgi:hypothetical protein